MSSRCAAIGRPVPCVGSMNSPPRRSQTYDQRMKVETIVSEWQMSVQYLPLSTIRPDCAILHDESMDAGARRGTGNILSQTTELSRVKARIKALADKTVSNGCTEAEAMAAAEMVGRLLERYALSMEEIDVREEPCVQIEVPIGGKQRRPDRRLRHGNRPIL